MNNKVLNFIIVILVIAILGIIGYFIYDRLYLFEDGIDRQDVSYDVNDYVFIEEVNLFNTSYMDVDKVIFKNLDVSIVNEFYDEQNRLINNAVNSYEYWASFNFEGISLKDGLIAYSDIWYQINDKILTVYYNMYFEDAIGNCNGIAVINVDLENKRLITDEELLKMGGTTFENIALEHYNNTLKNIKECEIKGCRIQDKDYNLITVEEFESNKDNYLKMIMDGLDGAIDCYIKDGRIKYDHNRFAIDVLYLGVGKGGCFDYISVEVGNYK